MTWVQEGIFAGGGEALPRAWADFAAQTGITAVLHLRPSTPMPFLGPSPASYLWLSLDDEELAGPEERWLAGTFIADCLRHGRRVLLHAARGRHRTRWAFVAYHICRGAAAHVALRRAAAPPWMAPYHTDRQAWELFAVEVQRRQADAPAEARR